MRRSARRLVASLDVLSKLSVPELAWGRIEPARVLTMFTVPVPIVPALDAPAVPGVYYLIDRVYVWKPQTGVGTRYPTNYGGAPGSISARYADGVTGSTLGVAFGAPLTGVLPNVIVLKGAAVGVGAPAGFGERHFLGLGANPTGSSSDSCPLYYAATFYRYTVDPPMGL